MSSELQDVDSAEFFWDNFAALGFENASRALVMAVKEGVDNSLDACEDIDVLPEIEVELQDLERYDDAVQFTVSDNASGIPREEIQNVFGEILYSSRFGRWKQSRGQQGIGISAVFLWSQKWIGEPATIISKESDSDARKIELEAEKKGEQINVITDQKINWDRDHGTEISLPIRANWLSRSHLQEYLQGTSLANPSAQITYTENDETTVYERTSQNPPQPPEEMRPHPHAADIGMLEQMLSRTSSRTVKRWLSEDFSCLGERSAKRICKRAGVDPDNPLLLEKSDLESLTAQMNKTRARAPGTDALSPLDEDLIEKTLGVYNPEFIGTSTRDVITVEGHPTIVETGVAYGGDIEPDGEIEYYRVANRVPLVYDASGCALRKAVDDVNWENYELSEQQGRPIGPAVVFIHICSTDIDFGNEAKTFVAQKPELQSELKLSLEECGRDFSRFLKQKRRRQEHRKKVEKITPIYEAISSKVSEVSNQNPGYLDSLARSCNTVVVGDGVVRNPTDKNRTIKIGDEEVEIGAGEQIEIGDEEINYHYHPIHV